MCNIDDGKIRTLFFIVGSLCSIKGLKFFGTLYLDDLDFSKLGTSWYGNQAIYNFGMNYIRTIIQSASRIRTIEGAPEYWDGRDDNGNLLPNGVYFYRVDIGDEEPLFGKIIYLQ